MPLGIEVVTLRSTWKPGKEEVVAKHGIVTAMQPPAAEAGLGVLKTGGNAVDAAVAMAFCNVVLEPYMATIAGMGYMLVHLAKERKTIAIGFNGRAPKKAHPDMYRVIGPAPEGFIHLFSVENDANIQGPLSVTVPGTCAALCETHTRYGTLPLEQIVEPAIHLASEGFEANWHLTLYVANKLDSFNRDPYLASMWLPQGLPPRSFPRPGERIVQRDLGELLKRIARQGSEAMYRGEIAGAIDEFMRRNGGILTRHDLEDYGPGFSDPLSMPFKGHVVKAVPTPSGAITNLEMFGILENFDLESMGHNSVDYLHLFLQSARHTFADRFRYLGDWEYGPVPLKGLLSPQYTKDLAKQVDLSKADVAVELDEEPWVTYMDRAIHDAWKYDSSHAPESVFRPATDSNPEDTTHINVVDKDRNAVSCTHTGVFTPGANPPCTGVYLVGGMAWFIPKSGYANSIAGWKRPLNNMSPLMVLREGRPVLCLGAPGARRIMNRTAQVAINILVFGMTPQEAIVQPTVDASGKDTLVDSRLPSNTVEELERRGHRVRVVEEEPGMTGNFSRPSAVVIDYERGLLRAGVDPFRPAIALGY
jgi:gamma-glutamyltranspeptidase/glutathione hydrolase